MGGSATALFCRPEYSGWRNHLCNSNRVFDPLPAIIIADQDISEPPPKIPRSPLGYPKVCKKSSGRTIMMKYLNTINVFHSAHTCPGDSVGTGLSGFDQGLAGSWVYLLRHASRPSMARSGADVLSAHGPRRYTQLPANCARLEVVASTTGYFSLSVGQKNARPFYRPGQQRRKSVI